MCVTSCPRVAVPEALCVVCDGVWVLVTGLHSQVLAGQLQTSGSPKGKARLPAHHCPLLQQVTFCLPPLTRQRILLSSWKNAALTQSLFRNFRMLLGHQAVGAVDQPRALAPRSLLTGFTGTGSGHRDSSHSQPPTQRHHTVASENWGIRYL